MTRTSNGFSCRRAWAAHPPWLLCRAGTWDNVTCGRRTASYTTHCYRSSARGRCRRLAQRRRSYHSLMTQQRVTTSSARRDFPNRTSCRHTLDATARHPYPLQRRRDGLSPTSSPPALYRRQAARSESSRSPMPRCHTPSATARRPRRAHRHRSSRLIEIRQR